MITGSAREERQQQNMRRKQINERRNCRVNLRPLLLAATALTVAATMWSEEKPDVPYPEGFRSWQHVISDIVGPEAQSFPARGGIHHFYANAKAVEGYRTGKFSNGSIL